MAIYEGFFRVSVVGTAGGQQIVNTFYYGGDNGDMLIINDALMSVFAAGWLANHGETYLGELPAGYAASQIEVSVVNERCVTVSENTVELAFVGAGDIAQTFPGPGLGAILSIKTSGVPSLPAVSLRRSYIVWGPVPSIFIQETGELGLTAKSAYANIAALIGASVTVGGIEYSPVRIGRTVAPAPIRVGTILSVSVKPFVRPRDSRFASDTGT